jgi:hypothetical protein
MSKKKTTVISEITDQTEDFGTPVEATEDEQIVVDSPQPGALVPPEGEVVEYTPPTKKKGVIPMPPIDPEANDPLKEAIIHVLAQMGANATLEGIQTKLTQASTHTTTHTIPGTKTEVEFDIEDYLDVPALFFCYKSAYTLFGDKRLGKVTGTPSGQPIRFTNTFRTKRYGRNPREVEVYHVSTAKIHSKIEAEWLRNHTLFNIVFFERIGDATTVDVYLAEKMAEVNATVSVWNAYQVIEKAKVMNIPITNDIENMRKQILVKMAQGEIQAQIRKSKDFAKKTGNLQVALSHPMVDGTPDEG